MSSGFRLALLASGPLALVLAMPASAQTVKREAIKPIADVSGAATFKEYCTACHGVSGKGDGPAAKALTKPPADLSQIAKRNGGKFPALSVRMTITGEATIAAHGSRDMPTWGPLFRSIDGDSVSALRAKNVVEYLEKMQEK
jgi:mono/diheme cytochrome c family protein